MENKSININNCKKILNRIYEYDRKDIIPYLRGAAGIGKTTIVYDLAKEKKCNIVELICSQITYTELSGMPMPDKETQTMTIYDNNKLLSLKDGDILFLDEFDKADVTVKSAVLKLLQERCLMSGKKLPDILIVAAGNQDDFINATSPCVRDRFFYIEILYSWASLKDYLNKKYNINLPNVIKEHICHTDTENIDWNALTPRTLEKLIKMMDTTTAETLGSVETFITSLYGDEVYKNLVNSFDEEYEEPTIPNSKKEELILQTLEKKGDPYDTIAKELRKIESNKWNDYINTQTKEVKANIIDILQKEYFCSEDITKED